ncbi:MAG: exodeoxyribonuclease VII small subunit [Kiritimatiellia bacterium]|jgi:exodeoxyribonuclease VII small subunit
MTDNSNIRASTYIENYRLLEAAAEALSKQETPDVDAIIPMVEQGTKAYENCIERIAEVEKMLAKATQTQASKTE